MDKIDVSLEDEIICACKEMIEIENHAYASFLGTKDEKWLKVLNKAREIRTKWMEKIFIEEEGTQKWCLEKHTFSANKRLSEVGLKLLSLGKDEEAKEAFFDSGEILGFYYFLNETKEIKENGGVMNNIKKGFKFVTGQNER